MEGLSICGEWVHNYVHSIYIVIMVHGSPLGTSRHLWVIMGHHGSLKIFSHQY
jgi:hypothetical protein